MKINKATISALCDTYKLGQCLADPVPCDGGFLHRCYVLKTSKGRYVLKALDASVVNQESLIRAEAIACELSSVVSVCTALHMNESFMLFPMIDGQVLSQEEILSTHTVTMATAIANIHKATLSIHASDEIALPCTLYQNSSYQWLPIVGNAFSRCLPILKAIYETSHKLVSHWTQDLVISHRDCDPKNVLWDKEGQYYIIDWELAGPINRTRDLITTALYWSFDQHYSVNQTKLALFLATYQAQVGPLNVDAIESGIYGLLDDWVAWLDLNFQRMLTQEYEIGIKEVQKTLAALPYVFEQVPLISDVVLSTYSSSYTTT